MLVAIAVYLNKTFFIIMEQENHPPSFSLKPNIKTFT